MPIWFELDHSLFAHFLLTPTAQGSCLKAIPIPVEFDRQGHAVSSSTGRKQLRFNFERGVKGNPFPVEAFRYGVNLTDHFDFNFHLR